MPFHKRSRRPVKGSTPSRGAGNSKSPRLSASYDPADLKIIAWLAKVKKIPAAQVMRDAVHAYVSPFKNNPNLKNQFGSEP